MTAPILFTGRGTSGSFSIRAEQLGRAVGGHVEAQARDVGGYRAAVVVKRAPEDLLQRLRRAEVPIVWDVVDAWPQPYGNEWDRATCLKWLRVEISRIKPLAIVAATEAMASDCAEFGLPTLALPHHARPSQPPTVVRDAVKVVGYEGAPHYLGEWRGALDAECAARGWRFEVNPRDWRTVDIGVALRDCAGYAPKNWKSNVKLANMQSAGTPCVLSHENGYITTASGAELWADAPSDLKCAFDALTCPQERKHRSAMLQAVTPHLATMAETYRAWLSGLKL